MSTSVGIWITGYVLAVAIIIVIGMAGEFNKIILEIKRAKIVR